MVESRPHHKHNRMILVSVEAHSLVFVEVQCKFSERHFSGSWSLSVSLCDSTDHCTMSRLDSVQTGLCPDWTLSGLDSVRTGLCPDWTLSRLDSVRTGLCPDWTLSGLDSVRTGLCSLYRLDSVQWYHSFIVLSLVMLHWMVLFSHKWTWKLLLWITCWLWLAFEGGRSLLLVDVSSVSSSFICSSCLFTIKMLYGDIIKVRL